MIPLTIKECGGQLPAWDDRYLPDNQASFAQNTFLYSGAIIGWRYPKKLRDLTSSTAKFAYRVPTISQGVATANLVFEQNPQEGDTVSLGEATYKFTATVTNAYDVLIGSSATASAQNLFLSFVFGAQDTAVCGIATLPNADIATNNPYVGFPFSASASTSTPGANTLALVKIIPSGTQKLTHINFMPASTSAGAKFKGVIYNNVNSVTEGGTTYNDQPNTLMATAQEVVGCTGGTIVTSSLPIPVTLVGGETYWIGFVMDTAVAFAQASDTANAINILNTYTNGPNNPVTGTGVTPLPISGGKPNYQIWGDLTTFASTDPINIIGTNDFGTGSLPYISVQAPDFGSAYNNTQIGESTSSFRLAWVAGLNGLSVIPILQGGANKTQDSTITGLSQWLEFDDPFTAVVKSPVVDDSFQRYYFASPSQPPQYNTYDRIANGQPPFLLGVPAPGCPPSVLVSGGGTKDQLGFPATSSTNTAAFKTDMLYLIRVQPAGAQSINDISAQIASVTGTHGVLNGACFVGVVYTDNNGVPGTLVNSGSIAPTLSTTSAFTGVSTFTTPAALSANTPYWIGCYFSTDGTIQLADDVGTGGAIGTGSTVPGGTIPDTGYLTMQGYPSGGGGLIKWTRYDLSGSITFAPPTAPTMTLGQQDWQIWADCTSSAQLESRAYVYTWVTEYGEEGPPSPPTLNDGWDNGIWAIDVFSPLAEEMGVTRNIVQTNLYRTVTGSGGGTTFFLVASFNVAQGRYIDISTDNIVAENLILPSTNWFGPPEGLEDLQKHPNGALFGFKGNEIWFCEPYRPHAWPPGYVITTEYPIVGLGASGQSIIACTSSSPEIIMGATPAVMSAQSANFPEPCTSRGGIVSTADAVLYPSENGLIKVTQGGVADNISQPWVTREKWTKYVPQEGLAAIPLMGAYFAFGTQNPDAQRGFTMELNSVTDAQGFGQWPQIGNHRLGLQLLTAPNAYNVDNVMLDPWSSTALLIQNGSIYYYDFQDQLPTIQPCRWRSKKYQTSHKDSFAAMRVWFDIPPGGPQEPPAEQTFANPTFTPSVGLPYVGGMFGVVRVLADGKFVMERELRYSSEMMRIPDGFKATTWQWEYEGIVSVTVIKAATSAKELGQGELSGRT